MPVIRLIQIHHEYVDDCDISCLNVFADLLAHPTDARQLRGSMAFSFKNRDGTDGPWAARPDVRRFVQAADRTYPFLPYFLLPAPEVKQVAHYIQCLFSSPMTQTAGGGYQQPVYPEEFFWLTYKKMHSLERFAQRTGDSEDEVVSAFIQALPALGDLTEQIQSLPLASLRTMFHDFFKDRDPDESFEHAVVDPRYQEFQDRMHSLTKPDDENTIRWDAAEIKKTVLSNVDYSKRWFRSAIKYRLTLSDPVEIKTWASLMLIVAGFLDEAGAPEALATWHAKFPGYNSR